MENIYMSGEGLCRTKGNASKCQKYSHPSHLFSEIVLLFFDFLVTGGTYMTTKLGAKCLEKNLKKTESKIFVYPHLLLFRKWR